MKLQSVQLQGLDNENNNMTLGIHAQDLKNGFGRIVKHNVYIGFLFFRLVLEFKYN